MALSTTTTSIAYTGNASTTVFSVPFKFIEAADLLVELTPTGGTAAPLVLDVDYTLSGADEDAGGSLTATTAPASGETLTITRVTPLTQARTFPTQGPFSPRAVEDGLDQAMMAVQDMAADVDTNTTGTSDLTTRVATLESEVSALETASGFDLSAIYDTPHTWTKAQTVTPSVLTATGVTGNGNSTGTGVLGNGGAAGGKGVVGAGGASSIGTGGAGVVATGGAATGATHVGGNGGTFTGGASGSAAGGAGISATGGNGTGASTGTGVVGTGGTNGKGVVGTGTGTGVGGFFTGGATDGSGVVGTGTGAGFGGFFTGGASDGRGVLGQGGGNGIGGEFIGSGTGVGVWALPGSTNVAVQADGYVDLDGGPDPGTHAALKNKATKRNVVKAWALIRTDAAAGFQGSNGVLDGFGISGCSIQASNVIRVTFTQAFANANFAIFGTASQSGPKVFYVNATTTTTLDVQVFASDFTTTVNPSNTTITLSLVVFGAH